MKLLNLGLLNKEVHKELDFLLLSYGAGAKGVY